MSLSPRALRRMVTWGVVLVVLVAGYAAFGFLAVPHLIRSEGGDFVARKYSRKLTLGEIRFNPFSFELELRDFSFPDADGQPMLGAHRLYVHLSLASIWNRGATFRDILLEQPFVRAQVRRNGELNLADLAKPFPPTPHEPASPPARLFISHLGISGADVSFEDLTRPHPFKLGARPLDFELTDFATVGTAGDDYSLSAGVAGGHLSWNGRFTLAPLTSRGHFAVDSVGIPALWSYVADSFNAQIVSGNLGFSGDYQLQAGNGPPALTVDVAELALTDLGMRPRQSDTDYVHLPKLEVRGTHVDLASHAVRIDSVALAGGVIQAWRKADGSINLLEMAGSPRGAEPARAAATVPPRAPAAPPQQAGRAADSAPASASVPATAAPTPAAWTVEVPQVGISDFHIVASDRRMHPAVTLEVDDIHVDMKGFKWPAGARLDLRAGLAIGRGRLTSTAQVSLPSGAASAHVDLRQLDLRPLQPYVAQQSQIALLSGAVSTRLDITRAADGGISVAGDASVAGFRTVDDDLKLDFIKWDDVSVDGIRFATRPGKLAIRSVTARSLYARVIILSDRTTNISEALHPPGYKPPPQPAAPASSSGSGQPRSGQSQSGRAPAGTTAGNAAAPAPSGPATPFPVSIGKVVIKNASANFADEWIQPHFAIGIQSLDGSIDGLSSDPASHAKVDLKGAVDRYAPIHIWGETNPFSATAYTDIRMNFRGVELSSVTPYSGHFAGYKIVKGKLTADISYKIDRRRLTAEHNIVIDQLQLGDKVDSPDAVHLPIKLAIALLKDRNGVINLPLPVTGSLDDPKFKLGPIIWQVFVNVLQKAVTAPFTLIGSLFGGGDQVNQLDFDPGSSTLDAIARSRVASLVKALTARPGLELDVPDGYNAALDGPPLATEHLDTELLRRAAAHADTRGLTDAAALQADPARHFQLLVAEYEQQLPGQPLPSQSAALVSQHARDSDYGAAIAELAAALLARNPASSDQLQALGTRRAHAVQDALLQGTGVDPGRIFIVNGPPAAAAGNKVRLALSLKR
ncbi:MAG TPA: DUF748 domain-containing protein [Steroidobacteraceae bacterium]|nr:DUF748 domain-containing protein [Steroidobacteraceae bacterium]